jgi:hypothetical protein
MKDLEVRTLGAEDATDWDSVTKEVTAHSVHGNKRDCAEDERLRKRELRKRGIVNMLNATDANERYVTEPRCMIEAMMSGAEVPRTPIVRNQEAMDAEGERDYGTCHVQRKRKTIQPPARGRAARRRRRGPGHAASRTPREVEAGKCLPRAGISRGHAEVHRRFQLWASS